MNTAHPPRPAQADALPDPPSAAERLASSRAALGQWLRDDASTRRAAGRGADQAAGPVWLQGLRQHPLAAFTLDAMSERWANHPLHSAVQWAEAAIAVSVVPLVRRHPVAVLVSAAGVGALLMHARPWRWALRPALLASLVARIAAPSYAKARPDPMQPGPASS